MKRFLTGLIIISSILLIVSGCSRINNSSYVQSRDNAYIASTNAPPLVVPPPLSRGKIKDTYVLTNLSGQPGISDIPPGVDLKTSVTTQLIYLPGIAASRIKPSTVANHPALLLKESLQQSWLIVGSGLRRQKIQVLQADRAALHYVIKVNSIYQVQLQQQTDLTTLIYITDRAGKPVADAVSNSLLASLSRGMQAQSKRFWSRLL